MSGGKTLDQIEIDLRNYDTGELHTLYMDVYDNSLSHKWLKSLNHLIKNEYHLEKNYCFVGFSESRRDGKYICDQINKSIKSINDANIGYHINDEFFLDDVLKFAIDENDPLWETDSGPYIVHERFNWLHRYFEELQGVSGAISPFYMKANSETKWHIRQLNLLCHEFEIWAKSYRKSIHAPEWQRPSQLMCWLNAPRFVLDESDYELFGIETINRNIGGVYVGVNKAIGKDHWEVFCDEDGADIDDLITVALKSQTEAAGDFDIEWAMNPGKFYWQKKKLQEFREWLIRNNFDPEDKSLTIGHPQVGQVNLKKSFPDTSKEGIWRLLNDFLDVYSIRTSDASVVYDYHWSEPNYEKKQIHLL